jgi:hypothetical protein
VDVDHPRASDLSNKGSSASSPLKTIQRAADLVVPGDVVCVGDGVYVDADGDDRVIDVVRGGTADRWVTFRALDKWGAIIEGENNKTRYGWNFGPQANYVRIENFEVRGLGSGGAAFWSNAGAHHVTIYGNLIHDIGREVYHGDWLSGGGGVYQGKGTRAHTYDSNIWFRIGRLPSGHPYDYTHDHAMYLNEGNDGTIVNNLFYENEAGWDIMMDGNMQGWRIINNTFASVNKDIGGQILLWVDGGHSAYIIRNNIFYHPKNAAIFNAGPNWGKPGNVSNLLLENNLVVGAPLINHLQGAMLRNNLESSLAGFRNAGKDDYHLTSSSPAIDAGSAEDAPQLDLDGLSRPQGAGVDIGAFEYVPPAVTFADVPADHWAYQYIEALYREGYIAGCSAEPLLYCPQATMTRAESAVFVERGIHGAGYLPAGSGGADFR